MARSTGLSWVVALAAGGVAFCVWKLMQPAPTAPRPAAPSPAAPSPAAPSPAPPQAK